ncbi:hypothetical protein VB711_11200 [Cronbergia sp. UHCC 0137]|uniref:hypothetical protein n=1 Tax=Cronbergia sp. UHCC 0137 TaxID=3110239 RepID=UPI002B205BA3|nr:hypothetical protein [Cronbergia sp. UHCC 0137]MEA5618400.1 hypothetical protein [Cronbergia sp. UHCC 0137]
MLAQFQSLYPNGSIVSELVQIFQGKYIVRVSINLENVTRATGMSAAETIEVAEDQARNRALMVLGINDAAGGEVQFSSQPVSSKQLNPIVKKSGVVTDSHYTPTEVASSQWSVETNKEISQPPTGYDSQPATMTNSLENQTLRETYHPEDQSPPPVEAMEIFTGEVPDYPPLSTAPPSNVTPFTPRSYSPREEVGQLGTGKRSNKGEPVNLSDVIAKTDVEIERLGWTKEQGREHLKKTYNKIARSLLSEEELSDFLNYLESQPDPIAGF